MHAWTFLHIGAPELVSFCGGWVHAKGSSFFKNAIYIMHACMHACMHTYIHVYIYTHIRMHVYIYICVLIHELCVNIDVCTYMCV